MRALLALILVLIGLPGVAAAHTRSESHSTWEVQGRTLRVTYSAPELEVKRLAKDGQPVSDAAFRAYVAKTLTVTAGDAACPRTEGPTSLASDPVFRRVQMAFACAGDAPMILHGEAFLDLAPNHMHFAQIQTDGGAFTEQLFDKADRTLDLSGGEEAQLASAGLGRYLLMGIEHIFTGVDHMCFLLGLVLISRRTKDLVFVVTGFTIGHSITLALAVTGILRPHAEYIDALVALTIALIGAENIAVSTRRPGTVASGVGLSLLALAALKMVGIGSLPLLITLGAGLFAASYLMVSGHLRDAGRLRMVVTLVFGLIHGFGFASNLLDMQIPRAKLAQLLVGFNAGVEIAQLTFVLTLVGLTALLRRANLALPRPLVVDAVAAGLVGVGVYWFVGRSFVA